jgi:3-dehydroquinate synthetase
VKASLEALELPSFDVGAHVFLSGPMGAGKSTVSTALGALLQREVVDLDRVIEARAGRSVRELFAARGEPAFRVLEAEVAAELAGRTDALVIALGGGTVASDVTRALLLRRGTMVHLHADVTTLLARARAENRPLLQGESPRDVMAALLAARHDAYAEAPVRVDTSAGSPEEIAREIERGLAARPVLVPLGRRSYCARFGPRTALVPMLSRQPRVLVVCDENTQAFGGEVCGSLGASGRLLTLPAGEAHKNIGALERIWDAASDADVQRDGAFVAVGGGVVGDVTGLAAATWLRGVPFIVVPTTLLSMADSAIGGKTAIDRGARKNLVGAFHQPSLVQIDIETLQTLPTRERRAGFGEIVKCAWLAGDDELAALERDSAALAAGEPAATLRALEVAVRVKARVVSADETEQGARRALNLGHTLGHAFESASAFELLHGEAVGLGLLAALRLAVAFGGKLHAIERISVLLSALGLPVDVERWLARDDLRALLHADKKRAGQAVAFVVPTAPGEVKVARLSADDILGYAREFGSHGQSQVP